MTYLLRCFSRIRIVSETHYTITADEAMASPPKSRSEIQADLTAAKQIQGPLFRVYYTMHNHMHSTFFFSWPHVAYHGRMSRFTRPWRTLIHPNSSRLQLVRLLLSSAKLGSCVAHVSVFSFNIFAFLLFWILLRYNFFLCSARLESKFWSFPL